ncbi:MAG: hypothetical protein ABH881_03450 [bacterium]
MILKFIIDKKYDKKFINKSQAKEFEELYKTSLEYMKYSQNEYQKSWDKINNDFSDYIEKQTGYKWFYNTYYCIISAMHPGISNWGDGPKIVRWWRENSFTQRRITAHELIISHYFEIFKNQYSEQKISKNQIWVLAEIAGFALTSLTPESKKFWPWDTSGYYTNHNYPQIVKLQNKLKSKFLNRKSFDEYIEIGIKLITDN